MTAVPCTIKSCSRCGEDHAEPLMFVPFVRPVWDATGNYTHWAFCPVSRDPILWRVQSDPPEKTVERVVVEPGTTTDCADPGLQELKDNGQQKKYLVMSEEERAKGFVRPVRMAYRHAKCGTATTCSLAIAETYARDPAFYGGTFCVHCGQHFRLIGEKGEPQFHWTADGTPVGS